MAATPSTDSTSATYTAHCHCGANTCTITLSPPLDAGHEVTYCNCSICARNGYLWVYVQNSVINFSSGGEAGKGLTKYSFGQKRIGHYFCSTCGTSLCARSDSPDFFPDMTGLNIRAIDDVDIESLKIKHLDGKSLGVNTEVIENAGGK